MFQKIACILKKTGNLKCLKKTESLDAIGSQTQMLHLRNLGLQPGDVLAIAAVLKQERDSTGGFLRSISFSYNNLMGDIGVAALVRSLPSSISEIGLVDCGIGDQGAREILQWMKTTPHLKRICMEQNNVSDSLKKEFNAFSKKNPFIMVLI